MKDWTEHIEDYLSGQLSPQDLKAFTKELETNATLKQEVALGKLLIEAIEKTGELDLKDYLIKHTTTATPSKTKYYWTFGAAAAILIFGIFMYNASEEPVTAKKEPKSYFGFEELENTTAEVSKAKRKKKTEPKIAQIDDDDRPLDSSNYIAQGDELAFLDENTAESRMMLSSNTIIPISIAAVTPPPVKESTITYDYSNSKSRALKKEVFSKNKIASRKDRDSLSAANNEKTKEIKKQKAQKKYTFQVSFYENESDTILLCNSTSEEKVDLEVDNLSPENAVILLYKNTYYLKSGEDFYQIYFNQSSSIESKITDIELIDILKGEPE